MAEWFELPAPASSSSYTGGSPTNHGAFVRLDTITRFSITQGRVIVTPGDPTAYYPYPDVYGPSGEYAVTFNVEGTSAQYSFPEKYASEEDAQAAIAEFLGRNLIRDND